jgi:hypothetical protein
MNNFNTSIPFAGSSLANGSGNSSIGVSGNSPSILIQNVSTVAGSPNEQSSTSAVPLISPHILSNTKLNQIVSTVPTLSSTTTPLICLSPSSQTSNIMPIVNVSSTSTTSNNIINSTNSNQVSANASNNTSSSYGGFGKLFLIIK